MQAKARLVLPPNDAELGLLGTEADRAARNRLQGRWLAGRCAEWVENTVEIAGPTNPFRKAPLFCGTVTGARSKSCSVPFSFSTGGLGLAPGNPLNLIQASETPKESVRLCDWFDEQWSALAADDAAKAGVVGMLRSLAAHCDPLSIYALILRHLFRAQGDELDEEQVVSRPRVFGIRKCGRSSSSSSETCRGRHR